MKIIADTNVLLRYILGDDPVQYKAAIKEMESATTVVVSNHALCEMVWVLRTRYEVSRGNIAKIVVLLRETARVAMDTEAADAGLKALEIGADFADGVIAHEGAWLGGEMFVSFDKKAVTALGKTGLKVKLLV
jgi:predicted nucleic-acid-binding protein